jgi:hypothetical protein
MRLRALAAGRACGSGGARVAPCPSRRRARLAAAAACVGPAPAAPQPPSAAAAALQQLLADRLALPPEEAARVAGAAAAPWARAVGGPGGPAAARRELAAGLDALVAAGLSQREVARLLLAQPGLVAAQIQPWLGFLGGIGLTPAQRRSLVLTCPEVRACERAAATAPVARL